MPLVTADHCPLPTEAGGASPPRLDSRRPSDGRGIKGEGIGEWREGQRLSRQSVLATADEVSSSTPRPVIHLPSSSFAAVGVVRRPAFLLFAFCFLLSNAVAAQPKFAELPTWVQPATNVLPATPRMASNVPPAAASAVSQATTNVSPAASTNSMDALDDQHKL